MDKIENNNNNLFFFYDSSLVPECLEWCNYNFVPKNDVYISCEDFGNINVENRKCWWCLEMLPYQWHMCCDEKNKNKLVKDGMTEQQAIAEIYKIKGERMELARKNEKD